MTFIEQVQIGKDRFGAAGFAKLVGVTRQTIYKWLDGEEPSRDNEREVARVVSNLPAQNAPVARFKPPTDEFRLIDAYDQRASAGPGAYTPDRPKPMHQLAFRHEWLHQITTSPDKALFVLFADGDSMEPTIHSGDTMLVDTKQTNPRKDGIYIIFWDDLINVKRITADSSSKTLSISSDNKKYTAKAGVKPRDIEIVGRVIWIGRRV